MKNLAYGMLIACVLAAFLSAVCLANGKAMAAFPLVINVVAVIVLARVVDGYERGGRR